MLFDEVTLRKLNRLTLVAHQVRAGVLKGERRSTRHGSSIEFADYRDYTPGDDLRRLDWNIYARQERAFIKLLEEEEDLAVHVLVDRSRSMDWGEADTHKFSYALRLAAALGAIALNAGDRLTTSLIGNFEGDHKDHPSPVQTFGPVRGPQNLLSLLKFLDSAQPVGGTDLNRSLREYSLAARRPGLALLISDFFAPSGYQEGLSWLQGRGYELVAIHLLSPDEIDPPLAGDLQLVDSETRQAQDVSLDAGLRNLYRQRVQAWQAEILAYCSKRNIRYLPLVTSTPWEKVVLQEMRKASLVK